MQEEKVISLQEAIRRLTGLPATNLELDHRGFIKKEMFADLVVFDPRTVRDTSTYEKPDQYSQGVAWVLINGTAVVANGAPTSALPGRILRGPGYKPGTP